MKKTYLVTLAVTLGVSAFGQIKMDNNGKVALRGTPTSDELTIYGGSSDATIKFKNGNSHEFVLGNYKTSLWGSPNTFSLWDKTSDRYLMEFRQDATYIHSRLVVGAGFVNLHRDYKGYAHGAINYDFNPGRANNVTGFLLENSMDESSGIYGDGDYVSIWSAGDFGYLLKVIDEDGMNLKWYVDGSGTAFTNSDQRRKENIKTINSSLDKIKNLNGVTYKFLVSEEEKQKNDSIINGLLEYAGDINALKENLEQTKSGFIAQELEKIIPEVVQTNERGNKFVNYDGIIPYLVEGIKEQQTVIEDLQAEIENLKEEVIKGDALRRSSQSTDIGIANTLLQNSPNPFSENTVIEYSISDAVLDAMICIYDMNGKQLKCIPLAIGNDNVTINGSEFSSGMYMYSLIADGQLIDTKRMILTD